MKGTVTINLEDYEKLKDVKSKTEELITNTKLANKELQVFLSFLCTRESIEPFVEEFNRQSSTSIILIENGRARIEIKNDND
jgi:hypothetical protein